VSQLSTEAARRQLLPLPAAPRSIQETYKLPGIGPPTRAGPNQQFSWKGREDPA